MFIKAKNKCWNFLNRCVVVVVLAAFVATTVIPPQKVYAQFLGLPVPGTMLRTTDKFMPAIVKGIKVDPNNPLFFNFLIDPGQDLLSQPEKKEQYQKLIKYFLASLTTPEKDMWVNLSPYEHSRIISHNFGQTEMGRDMLAQDYILKQLTASLIYPEDALGQKFWKEIRERVRKETGGAEVPVNTYNKVWIIPDKATVFEKGNVAMVTDSHLKVMLDQDYLSLDKHANADKMGLDGKYKDVSRSSSEVVREIVLPAIEKEVNEGRNFAQLRQMYNSMILASWFKQRLKMHVLTRVYANKDKSAGVELKDLKDNERVFQEYVKAFKKGVYNYVKDEENPVTGEKIPRKYFSGGFSAAMLAEHPVGSTDFAMGQSALHFTQSQDAAMGEAQSNLDLVGAQLDAAQSSGKEDQVQETQSLGSASQISVVAQGQDQKGIEQAAFYKKVEENIQALLNQYPDLLDPETLKKALGQDQKDTIYQLMRDIQRGNKFSFEQAQYLSELTISKLHELIDLINALRVTLKIESSNEFLLDRIRQISIKMVVEGEDITKAKFEGGFKNSKTVDQYRGYIVGWLLRTRPLEVPFAQNIIDLLESIQTLHRADFRAGMIEASENKEGLEEAQQQLRQAWQLFKEQKKILEDHQAAIEEARISQEKKPAEGIKPQENPLALTVVPQAVSEAVLPTKRSERFERALAKLAEGNSIPSGEVIHLPTSSTSTLIVRSQQQTQKPVALLISGSVDTQAGKTQGELTLLGQERTGILAKLGTLSTKGPEADKERSALRKRLSEIKSISGNLWAKYQQRRADRKVRKNTDIPFTDFEILAPAKGLPAPISVALLESAIEIEATIINLDTQVLEIAEKALPAANKVFALAAGRSNFRNLQARAAANNIPAPVVAAKPAKRLLLGNGSNISFQAIFAPPQVFALTAGTLNEKRSQNEIAPDIARLEENLKLAQEEEGEADKERRASGEELYAYKAIREPVERDRVKQTALKRMKDASDRWSNAIDARKKAELELRIAKGEPVEKKVIVPIEQIKALEEKLKVQNEKIAKLQAQADALKAIKEGISRRSSANTDKELTTAQGALKAKYDELFQEQLRGIKMENELIRAGSSNKEYVFKAQEEFVAPAALKENSHLLETLVKIKTDAEHELDNLRAREDTLINQRRIAVAQAGIALLDFSIQLAQGQIRNEEERRKVIALEDHLAKTKRDLKNEEQQEIQRQHEERLAKIEVLAQQTRVGINELEHQAGRERELEIARVDLAIIELLLRDLKGEKGLQEQLALQQQRSEQLRTEYISHILNERRNAVHAELTKQTDDVQALSSQLSKISEALPAAIAEAERVLNDLKRKRQDAIDEYGEVSIKEKAIKIFEIQKLTFDALDTVDQRLKVLQEIVKNIEGVKNALGILNGQYDNLSSQLKAAESGDVNQETQILEAARRVMFSFGPTVDQVRTFIQEHQKTVLNSAEDIKSLTQELEASVGGIRTSLESLSKEQEPVVSQVPVASLKPAVTPKAQFTNLPNRFIVRQKLRDALRIAAGIFIFFMPQTTNDQKGTTTGEEHKEPQSAEVQKPVIDTKPTVKNEAPLETAKPIPATTSAVALLPSISGDGTLTPQQMANLGESPLIPSGVSPMAPLGPMTPANIVLSRSQPEAPVVSAPDSNLVEADNHNNNNGKLVNKDVQKDQDKVKAGNKKAVKNEEKPSKALVKAKAESPKPKAPTTMPSQRKVSSLSNLPPPHSIFDKNWSLSRGFQEGHYADDIATPIGEKVMAAYNGKVVFAGDVSGYGRAVVIMSQVNNVWISQLVGHVSKTLVSVGDKVVAGQVIALSGKEGSDAKGNPVGAHAHVQWEVHPKSEGFGMFNRTIGYTFAPFNRNPGLFTEEKGYGLVDSRRLGASSSVARSNPEGSKPAPASTKIAGSSNGLKYKVTAKQARNFEGILTEVVINGEKFYGTNISFYSPDEGKASTYHGDTKLTPGISAASLDFPLGTVLEVYNAITGSLERTVVVADVGGFSKKEVLTPVMVGQGKNQKQLIGKNGKPVFQKKYVLDTNPDGTLKRNARNGLDIQVASKKEYGENIPVLLRVAWLPSKHMNFVKEALPQEMVDDKGNVSIPTGGLQVLDIRNGNLLIRDEKGGYVSIKGLKNLMVKVGDRLEQGSILGQSTSRTACAFLVKNKFRPIAEFITPGRKLQEVAALGQWSQAMTTLQGVATKGGIDFDPKYLQLNLQGDAMNITVPKGFEWLLNTPIRGFTPQITDIRSGLGFELSFFKGLLTSQQQREAKSKALMHLASLCDHKFIMKSQFA